MMRRHSGLTRGELLMVVVLIAVVLAVLLPGSHIFCCGGRASNERNASTSLKTIASAEADFRANDRDGNGLNDFWTTDVKGLYTLTSAAVPGAKFNNTLDPSIKLIELSVACADADGTFFPAGGENVSMTNYAIASPKAGYWFAALRSDPSTTGASKFGFAAFPDTQMSGKDVFMLNENNTIYRTPVTGPCRSGTSNPPGLSGVPAAYLNWPDEKTLKAQWSKLD